MSTRTWLICVFLAATRGDETPMARELDPSTFLSALADGPLFVKFYAPWCGHCKALRPTWEKLSEETFATGVRFASVDCTKHAELCQKHGVQGYPTLKMFGKALEGEPYKGGRNEEDLRTYAESRGDLASACGIADPSACEEEKERSYAEKWASSDGASRVSERGRLLRLLDSASTSATNAAWILRRAQMLHASETSK